MGGDDKAWLPWQCSTLIETVAAALRPQVDELLVVANRYPERYAGIGLRCVSDRRADYPGPMAGLEAGLYASDARRSEEHTSELQSLMRISYAVFCLHKTQ